MNNKELENKAIRFLMSKLSADGYECTDVHSNRRKGWDLEAKKDEIVVPIEVKCTRAEKWADTNLRFTWQTLCSAYKNNLLNQLVIAVVMNTETDNPTVEFIRFCDVKGGELFIEPHFLIQLNRLKREGLVGYKDLDDVPIEQNDMMERFRKVLESPISNWVDITS